MSKPRSIDDILDMIPYGKFQLMLLFTCGFIYMSDSVQVNLLGYVSACAGADFGLTDTQVATVTAIIFIGEIFGSMIWGPLADICGRRQALLYALCILVASGWLSGGTPDFWTLIITQFMAGVGIGATPIPWSILTEFSRTEHRANTIISIGFFWTGGGVMVNSIAWALLDSMPTSYNWRVLIFVSSLPITIFSVVAFLTLPESPRWLISQGRYEEAEKVLKSAASMNGVDIGEFTLIRDRGSSTADIQKNGIDDIRGNKISRNRDSDSNDGLCSTLAACGSDFLKNCNQVGSTISHKLSIVFEKDTLPTTLALMFSFIAYAFCYYGIVILAEDRIYINDSSATDDASGTRRRLADDDGATCSFTYLPLFLGSASEVAGVLICFMMIEPLGRLPSHMTFFAVGSLAYFLLGSNLGIVTTAGAYFIGRCFIRTTEAVNIIRAGELYPTATRSVVVSFFYMFARIGAFVSTYYVEDSYIPVTFIAYSMGIVCAIGVFVVGTLRETKGKHLDSAAATGAIEANSEERRSLLERR